MRNAYLESILLCLAMLFAVFCHAAEEPAAGPQRRENAKKETPDEKGLRQYLKKTIAKANWEAASLRGKTFVEHHSFERAIYFVPKPPPPPPPRVEMRDGRAVIIPSTLPPDPLPELEEVEAFVGGMVRPTKLPDGCVEKTWVDDYCLAQQYSYRFKLLDTGPIAEDKEWKVPAADVRLKLIVERKTHIAAREKPIPKPAEGQRIWRFLVRSGLLSRYGGVGFSRELKGISMPSVAKPDVGDTLAEEAAGEVLKVPEERHVQSLTLQALYVPQRERWVIQEYRLQKSLEPVRLGDMRFPRGAGVYTFGSFDTKRESPSDKENQKAGGAKQP